jgi:hypothetical protein
MLGQWCEGDRNSVSQIQKWDDWSEEIARYESKWIRENSALRKNARMK